MNRFAIAISLVWILAAPPARGDGPMGGVASQGWAITDVVLARHLDPPTRQQMLLDGLKAMAGAAKVELPPGLARRVSMLQSPEGLAPLLAETLAGPKASAEPGPPAEPGSSAPETPEAAFLEGLLAAVPGDTSLMTDKERKVQDSFEANLYVGVQVQLGMDEKQKRPVFMKVLEGGPADKAGARDGDLVDAIEGESTEGMDLRQVVDRLRGAEGTDVLVTFRHPDTGASTTRPMTRGRLPRATIEGLSPLAGKRWDFRLDGPAPIGYLKIKEVSGSTPQELRAIAARLDADGTRALILDLEETSQAALHPIVLLADALLDGGVIGRVRSIDGEKVYRADADALFRGWPIVVLAPDAAPQGVAWLCGALRDNHRATILGDALPISEPSVSERVPVPGGEWSVQMVTGQLVRGDGQLLQRRKPDRTPANAMIARRIDDRLATPRVAGAAAGEPASKYDYVPVPNPSRPGTDRPSFAGITPDGSAADVMVKGLAARKQAHQRDLDRAREILTEALKSAGK